MAASGSFKTGNYDGRYLTFSWSETSQNVTNNTTTISWRLTGEGGDSTWYNSGNFKVVIAGEVVYSSATRIQLKKGTVVASGTYTFKHNADGTKSFTASAEAGIYTVAVNCTGSGTFTLDTIPRASQPSLITWPNNTQNVGNFGTEISIHMNRNSSAFTHTVRYQFGSRTGTIATGVTTGTTWVIPLALMDLIPNSTSGSGTVYVDTYNGSTKIGTKSCGFTATVPASVKPTCTLQVLDATTIQATYGNLVKGLSRLLVKTGGTPAYSSPIASRAVTANGVRYTAAEVTTGFLTSAGTTTVTATVTDKRGRTSAQKSASFTVLDYEKPAITSLSVRRCNADGTANNRGEYVKAVFSAAVTSLGDKNGASYTLRYKKTSATAWTTVTLTDYTNKYAVTNAEYVFPADGANSYNVEVTAKDSHYTGSKSTSASTAFTLVHYNASGDGVSFGMVDDEAGTMTNGLALKQQGNRYCYSSIGAAETDGYILMARITVTATNADTPMTFVFSRRKAAAPMTVHVCLAATADLNPGLSSIRYEGENYGAFLVQSSTSVWDLYVQKVNQSDTVTLNDWHTSNRQQKRVAITFPGSIVTTVPSPYYRATPLVLRSTLDAFMPVGFVLTLYSHADPNEMYPGTTWERLENTLLWATTPGGVIGWVSAQAAKATSGGYAFTQVSVWRRTA